MSDETMAIIITFGSLGLFAFLAAYLQWQENRLQGHAHPLRKTIADISDSLQEMLAVAGFLPLSRAQEPQRCGDMFAGTGDSCSLNPGHVGVHEHNGRFWFGNAQFKEAPMTLCQWWTEADTHTCNLDAAHAGDHACVCGRTFSENALHPAHPPSVTNLRTEKATHE